jgi:hypothetical protein
MDFPYGLQDITKSLREVLRIFDDVAKRGGKAVKFWHRRRRKDAAKNLDYLRFHEGGMIKHLRLIAEGKFSHEDIQGLKRELNTTAEGVGHAIATLRSYHDAIREQLSLRSAMLLEEIIQGESGKSTIRIMLREISAARFAPESENYTEWVRFHASLAIRKIAIMNTNIIDLHDSLIAGKRVTKRVAKVKKGTKRANPAGKKGKGKKTGSRKRAAKAKRAAAES